MTVNTSFSGVNQQLNFAQTSPITINDRLVRALTGLASDIPAQTSISFADLAGKYGVGPILGPVSNSQASYFTTNSSINLQFLTDVYQANVVWSYTLISGDSVVFTPTGANVSVLLSRPNIGNSSANVHLVSQVYYGNTLIGSNSIYVNLKSTVYNSNLTFSSTPSSLTSSANGYSAQTASVSVTAQANVPGATINWSVVPNTVGAVLISGNTVTLTSTANKAGITNSASYQLTATVMLSGKAVSGATGAVVANVYATMYGSDFSFVSPSNTAVASNTGPLTVSVPFSVSGNAPGSVITWSSSRVSGSNATLSVATGNLAANLSLVIASNNTTYGAANSVMTVTAKMYSDASLSALIATHSANISLQGLVYGLDYTAPANVSVTGFTSQTATSTATATYKAGTFAWSYSATSGVASVALSSGAANGTSANISFTDTVSQRVGSNASTWTVTPTLSYGSILVSGPSSNLSINATIQAYTLSTTGSLSNTQYANNGPLNSSVTLAVANSTPPGTNVVWTATQSLGSNASLSVAANNQNATLTLSLDANTFTFSNAVYNLIANCYETSTGWSLNSKSQAVSLVAGTYGLNISSLPASNTQSGYNAQTASTSATASVKAGTFAWWYSNTVGLAPAFSMTGISTSSTASWKQTVSAVGSNTATETMQIAVFSPSDPNTAIYTTGTLSTFSLTAQQNAYSFSTPVATTNTQLLGSTASNLSITTAPTCNIAGYTLTNWACSNTTNGYSFSSNATASVIGFGTTLTSAAPVAYYTTTITGTLLDGSGRSVQTFSYPVILRSYFPNPIISFGNTSSYGYVAQTASNSYLLTVWNGATALSVGQSVTGTAPTLTNGVQNTSYWNMSYSLSTGSTYQDLSSIIIFQPTISFYDQVSNDASWAVTAALVANNYNPAVIVSGTNGSVAGWTGAQTAYGVLTASANASVPSVSWRWGAANTTSGSFSSSYLQGTGNNQFVLYNQESSIGTLTGAGYVVDVVLVSGGTDIIHYGATPSVSASATKYNPALVISGPSSNSTSANFTSTASIVLTASANASIPGVSYQVSAAAVSGSASVSYGAGNTSCTLSVTGLHTTASATYNVTFSVLSSGTVVQTSTRQVSLSATGVIPNYSLTTPGNVSAAGFNFAQTCSSTCYLNGITGQGDFATWNMVNVSGITPAWSTPGGSNSYITTTQSCGSVGSVSGTIYQTCNIYDPSGNYIKSINSGQYALTSTVYNPAFGVSVANAAVSGGGTLTATSSVSLSSNATGGAYQLSIVKSSGATGTVSIAAGNTSGTLKLTSASTANAVYSYNASILLNGQTIAGPITGTMYSAVTITYNPVTATVSPTSISNNSGQYGSGNYTLTTSSTTATGHAGDGSYTYSWIRTGGSTILTAVNPTSATTAFKGTLFVPPHGSNSTVTTFICKISDGTSSANTPTVTASISDTDNS